MRFEKKKIFSRRKIFSVCKEINVSYFFWNKMVLCVCAIPCTRKGKKEGKGPKLPLLLNRNIRLIYLQNFGIK